MRYTGDDRGTHHPPSSGVAPDSGAPRAPEDQHGQISCGLPGCRRGLPQAPLPEEGRRRLDPARRPGRQLRHLRRLRGLELRPGRRRLGRPDDRHHLDGADVQLHGLRPGRDVLGPPGRRRRLRLRATRTRSDRRLRHRNGRSHRVRRRSCRHRDVHRRLRRGARSLRAHQRLAGLPDRLCVLRRGPPVRRRRGTQADVRHHGHRCRRADRRSHRSRAEVLDEQPLRHRARRIDAVERLPALRHQRRRGRARLRHLVLPGGRGCAPCG